MANYNDLITAIDSVIKTNNRREITGQLLQNVLNTMVGSLGENYQLAGFATPTTNPHQPDQNVFYVASQAGVYTQFDNIVLGDGISFLMWKNGAWTSQTISMVTQSWVQQNYVSKEWFRKVFRVYDEDGLEIVPNDMDSVVDNIKAMVGLWTNEYLSALGMGRDGGGTTQTLAQLNDVQLGTLENGDALVYNTAIHKWENKQIQTGVDMSVVWAAFAANTNEQINASHLATALSSYVTSANLSTMLNDYATKAWAGQNFITVEWFDKLFQLYNGTEAEANKIAPNGALPIDQTNLNIEAMFGFWTKKYISALGQGDDGTSYTTLAQLNDVTITNPQTNQVLKYNGTHWVNAAAPSGASSLSGLTDVDISTLADKDLLQWDYVTGKWKNVVLSTAMSAYALTSAIPTNVSQLNNDSGYITSSALSGYLPLTGGTLAGASSKVLTLNAPAAVGETGLVINRNGSTKAWFGYHDDGFVYMYNYQRGKYLAYYDNGTLLFEGYTVIHSGNIGLQSVNYATSAGSATYDSSGYTIANTTWVGNNYLPLTGGTLTGSLSVNSTITSTGGGRFGGSTGVWIGATYSGGSGGYDCIERASSGATLYMQYYHSGNVLMCYGGGKVGIGDAPSYKLHVAGDIYATGGVTSLSDIRHKTIVEDTRLQVSDIARMRAVRYVWNDGRKDNSMHVGSIAQDWQQILPEVVLRADDTEGTLSLKYGVAALISAITVARKVLTHEEEIALLKTRVSALEKENGEQEQLINSLQEELSKFKAA